MTPNEALTRAISTFGTNLIVVDESAKLEEIIRDALEFYSENTVVDLFVFPQIEQDKTDPPEDGVFTFDLPLDFRFSIGLCDNEGIEQLYRVTGSQVVVTKCEESTFPLEFNYAVDMTDWDLDSNLPAKLATSPLIKLIRAKVAVYNNECLRAIGKLTQTTEESLVDWEQKVADAEDEIKNRTYIPQGKSF